MKKLSKSKMKCLTSAIVLTLFTAGALVSVAGSAEAAGYVSGDAKDPGITISGHKLKVLVAGKNSIEVTNTKKSGYKEFTNINVAGGASLKGKVSGKTATLAGPTVKDTIWGGLSLLATAEANKVIINSGRVADAIGGEGNVVTKNSVTINGGNIEDVTGANADDTATGNSVTLNGGKISCDVYGAQSSDGNAVQNRVIVNKGSIGQDVYGAQSQDGNATGNGVVINGAGAPVIADGIIGGITNSEEQDKAANNNYVILKDFTKTEFSIKGGEGPNANGNTLIVANSTLKNMELYAGKAKNTANNNSIVLVGVGGSYSFTSPDGQLKQNLSGTKATTIDGVLNGGVGKSSAGNTLKVLGTNTKVGGINAASFQNMQFYINDKIKYGSTMLSATGTNAINLSKTAVKVTMQGKPQGGTSGSINLLTAPNASLTAPKSQVVEIEKGKTLKVDGKVGLDSTKKKLVLTINKITGDAVNEIGKSLVESRAAAAAAVNNAADFLLEQGLSQAQAATQAGLQEGTTGFVPFAAMGGGKFKYSTGSHVDIKSWNAAVGLAKAAGDCVYGVAVEHGRGDYDSYLDNGYHAEGDLKATGGVLFAEVKKQGGVHYDAALRAGRISTDYNNDAGVGYDDRATYLGFSLGGGKEFSVNDKASVDVYGRFAYSHTASSDVLSSDGNENYFDAVDSKRLRVGARYVLSLNERSKLYTGAAWQYEFDGDARGYIDGYGAPVPSLKGHSGMVELGYKLEAGKNLSLDFNVNGWAGKQKGVAGGIGLQWKF